VPFTLVDWDAEQGTITMVIEEVGRSSQEIRNLQAGDIVAHVSGPLGLPLPIDKDKKTVVLGGGCYGIGAIYPIARAYKQAGAKVIAAIEGCSAHMLYMEQELRSVCDKLYIATKDGSRGRKGGVQDVFIDLQKTDLKIDEFIVVGCTFLMRQVAQKTSEVPLQVALNPIMVDGTGMCGACRVAVGTETKFACVDGPFFDGRAVDWDELTSRRSAYLRSEVEAIPQDTGAAHSDLNVLAESRSAGA
jgi:NAD(P)H-flavin reductase